jgi:hypothetical protein
MGVSTFPTAVSTPPIQPTKPNYLNYNNASPTVGTWYTALDVTSGSGKISRISASTQVMSGGFPFWDAVYTEVKITVDGVATTVTPPISSNIQGNILGLQRADGISGASFIDFIGEICFKSTAKIEIRLTSTGGGTSPIIACGANYSLV